MSKFINQVPVNEEIYKEYYKMKRRERYFEQDIKVGRSVKDPETGEVKEYKPSKEDSIQRLMDKGQAFADDEVLEDVVVDKAMLLILQEAMKEDISHVAVMKRRDKILNKLRSFF